MQIRELTGPLEPTNDGQLTIFPVGTGSAFTKKNYQNNYLLIKGDNHLMIDCGTRTPEAFSNLGLPITAIKNFLITHSHADHIGGLEEVILMGRYVLKQKPHIIITAEYQKKLWNDSLKGGAAWNETMRHGFLTFKDYWDIHRPKRYTGLNRTAWEIDFGGINLILFRTKHYPDAALTWKDSAFSIGAIIDRKIFFSGDTMFDPELIEDVSSHFDLELYMHDIQFFPGGIHAPFSDLKTIDESIRAKTLLMHYPDNYENYDKEVRDAGFLGFVKQHHYYDFT